MATELKKKNCRYIYDKDKRLTLREVFDNEKQRFPVYFTVLEGFIGTCKYDDLSSDNVLRIHGRSRQRRVIGRTCDYFLDLSKFYSIPVNDELRFCVKSGGRKNKVVHHQQSLPLILKENKYPIEVEYSVDTGPSNCLLNEIGKEKKVNVAILGEYQEEFLLCNSIFEGFQLNKQMFLSSATHEVDCAEITGIEGVEDKTFQRLLKDHEEILSKSSILHESSGNPDITKVTIEDGTGSGNRLPEFIIPFLNVGKPTDPPPRPMKLCRPLPKVPDSFMQSENESNEYDITNDGINYDYPQLNAIPKYDGKDKMKTSDISEKTPIIRQEVSLTDPKHIGVEIQNKSRKAYPGNDTSSGYSKFPTKESHQTLDSQPLQTKLYEKPEEKISGVYSGIGDWQHCTEQNSWLINLSVSQVGEYLKELALKKYVNRFAKERIDGNILKELTREILEEEFHFSGFEAIKLMKFIKTGHIPKL